MVKLLVLEKKIKIFQKNILDWSKDNLIDYPWRKDRNPYRVFISEILLIRTKASQVTPVYKDFINIYSNLEKFIEMDLKTVKTLIKSLGLLFRAEILQEITNQIKNEFNNKIPDSFKELKSLKGIGNYGANAILCFGFEKKRPLLDSNFIRLYKRVFNISPKTKTAKSDKFLWEFSEQLLPEKDFIIFNYGVLDFGGQICLPKKPKCGICPLKQICVFFKKQSKNFKEN